MVDTAVGSAATAVADVSAGTPADGDLDLGYQVSIEAFSGPLDLLLYLVRRAQVDVTDVPIAEIADQFVAAVGSWPDLDLDVAGDFILMAATLLEIKSRAIMPPVEGDEGAGDGEEEWFDPRADLIRQLLAYRRFKDASGILDRLEHDHAGRCARQLHESIPEDPDEAETWSLDNADPYLLFRAWEGVLAKIAGLGPRTVIYDDVPIEARMAALSATMQATREARLSWLLESVPARIQRVGLLVAMLECVRQRIVEALQYEQYGEVFLRFRDEVERAIAAVIPPEAATDPTKRRRRRPPLVTWQAPAGASVDAEDDVELVEEVIETDEQRFVRELNESCRVDAVLATVADLEAGFTAFRQQLELDRANATQAEATPDAPEPVAANAAADGPATPSSEAVDLGPRFTPLPN